jgi:hypothetical protein
MEKYVTFLAFRKRKHKAYSKMLRTQFNYFMTLRKIDKLCKFLIKD